MKSILSKILFLLNIGSEHKLDTKQNIVNLGKRDF